jgi:predicted outer membrane protein
MSLRKLLCICMLGVPIATAAVGCGDDDEDEGGTPAAAAGAGGASTGGAGGDTAGGAGGDTAGGAGGSGGDMAGGAGGGGGDSAGGAAATGGAAGTTGTAGSGTAGSGTAGTGSGFQSVKLGDGGVAMVLAKANTGEIHLAQLALQHAVRNDVRDFAAKMIAEHGESQSTLQQVLVLEGITLRQSPISQQLDEEASLAESRLSELGEDRFDHGYLVSQVAMHSELLVLLRSRLIPAAHDPLLLGFLWQTELVVQGHLADARKLLDTRTGVPGVVTRR